MIIIGGVRYREEDALRLGLSPVAGPEPTAKVDIPAAADGVEPTPNVADEANTEAADGVEPTPDTAEGTGDGAASKPKRPRADRRKASDGPEGAAVPDASV